MTEEECRAADVASRRSELANKRCARFEEACENCGCEKFSIGENSPGVVSSDEELVRFHFSPNDFGDDGSLTTLAFSDVTSLGLSVTRDQATNQQMQDAISARLKRLPPEGEWVSVSIAQTGSIKSIFRNQPQKDPERAFCVYDTAEPDNPLHAEVCQTKAGRKFRADLRNAFNAASRAVFRDGVLNPSRE